MPDGDLFRRLLEDEHEGWSLVINADGDQFLYRPTMSGPALVDVYSSETWAAEWKVYQQQLRRRLSAGLN